MAGHLGRAEDGGAAIGRGEGVKPQLAHPPGVAQAPQSGHLGGQVVAAGQDARHGQVRHRVEQFRNPLYLGLKDPRPQLVKIECDQVEC